MDGTHLTHFEVERLWLHLMRAIAIFVLNSADAQAAENCLTLHLAPLSLEYRHPKRQEHMRLMTHPLAERISCWRVD